ncbi:MAG: alpha/beta hydrolase [Rhizobiales bacterium]|nr:alpha/beta hydrolase [Hyphomicrobiales bacterium]
MTDASTGLDFVHRFEPATKPGRPPLLLLHGTGGDENDLIPIGVRIAPGSALLSPRGKVRENGMLRFFRRLAEGVFDLDDLKSRAHELGDFVERASEAYGLATPIAIGFSNGANIASALMLSRPHALAGAVLMRGTVPFVPDDLPDLLGVPVLILAGKADPLVSSANRAALAELLSRAGAAVTAVVVDGGHSLTPQDVAIASRWLAERG